MSQHLQCLASTTKVTVMSLGSTKRAWWTRRVIFLGEGEEAQNTVIGSPRDDGKYYAGSDRWVNKESWELLMKAPTDSMFCRSAAMIYWSPEQLRNRSVTGTLSNKCRALGKTVAKPALTPEKVSSLKGMLNRLKMWYHR
ncbi:hypothetical protein MTO96_002245 [Rhipicephalus appendiculatus]